MKKRSLAGKLFFCGAVAAAVFFVAAIVLFAVSVVKSGDQMDLGYDLNSRSVVKMAIGENNERVAGTQHGEVFSFDENGELLWDLGSLNDRSVYDLVLRGGKVYVVYADGTVYVFEENDARTFSASRAALLAEESSDTPQEGGEDGAEPAPATGFSEHCEIYRLDYSIGGNVSNTQLLATDGAFYLRCRLNDGSNRYYLYRFEEGGSPERIRRSSFAIGGMAMGGDDFYYSYRGSLYMGETELFNLDEDILALSSTETELSILTASSTLVIMNLESKEIVYREGLPLQVDTGFVFSTGRNFLVKIKNGGVAMVGTEERAVTLSMAASNNANFILWNDDCFTLRDSTDINNPTVVFYSVSMAKSISLFHTLKWTALALALVFALLAVLCALCVKDRMREKIGAETVSVAKSVWRNKAIYLALVIPFALLIIFYYIPIVLGFSISFLDYIPGEKSVFVGFDYFAAVLKSATFWDASLSMVIFLITDLLKALIPPFIIAELIFAVRFKRFSLWVRILLFLPGILPGVATALVWAQGIFGATPNSLINAFARLFVPSFAGLNWINNPSMTVRITSVICFGFPWVGSYLIFFGALGGINSAIFEAAKLDGCSWFRRIIRIDIPMILSQFKYVLITSFIASVQNYGTLYILYGADGSALIKTPALLMYGEIMSGNYSTASVMGVFLFIVLAVMTVLNFRSQREQID